MPPFSHRFFLPAAVVFLLSSFSGAFHASAQESYPEIEAFAKSITGVIWDLRGTNSLKHLSFDGESLRSLDRLGNPRGSYDHSFVDDGVIRIDFKGPNAGWYFFSDDLKWVTPLTIEGEIVLKLTDGSTPKPIKQFPEDIVGQVWDSELDERGLNPMKFRWNGTVLETAVKNGDEWQSEKLQPIIAGRRVFETELGGPGGPLIWLAFSADGKEAWFLQVKYLFGGNARTAAPQAALTPETTGLKPNYNDIANHAADLLAAGEKVRAETLRRHLVRLLEAEDPSLIGPLNQRLAAE